MVRTPTLGQQQYELLPGNGSNNVPESSQLLQSQGTISDEVSGNRFPRTSQAFHYNGPHVAALDRLLRVRHRTFAWTIISHFIVLGIVVAMVVLGAIGQTYKLGDASFAIVNLSIDNQMFLFGLFNKAADYVLNDSIARISGVLLTVWMSQPSRFAGAGPEDFQLSEQMSKPWISIFSGITRWKKSPPKKPVIAIVRILASFASGMAVLLLGGAFNVIAMPKLRWAPGPSIDGSISQGFRVRVSTTQINDINWSHVDNGYNMLNVSSQTSSTSGFGNTIIATSVLEALANLNRTVQQINGTSPDGFFTGIAESDPGSMTMLYSVTKGVPFKFYFHFDNPPLAVRGRGLTFANLTTSEFNTISLQEGLIYDFWQSPEASADGPKAIGARNWLNFTFPILTTDCTSSDAATQALTINPPNSDSTAFTIDIPSSNGSTAVTCNIAVRQSVYPVYIYNTTQDARDEVSFRDSRFPSPDLGFTAQNTAIATSLSIRLDAIIQRLELLTGTTFSILIDHLLDTYVDASSNHVSRLSMMNILIGTISQHLVTIARWDETPSSLHHEIGPLQYQLYGSGPRLSWQWVIGIIPGLVFLILAYDMFLMFYKRTAPGPWLDLAGMLMAANSAAILRSPDDDADSWALGDVTEEVEKMKFYIRPDGHGTLRLTNSDTGTRKTTGIED